MEKEKIDLADENLIIKRYKIRVTGSRGRTIETSVPREAFEREARRLGLAPQEALEKLLAVWRFNNFKGLHLSFELKKSERHSKREGHVEDPHTRIQQAMNNGKKAAGKNIVEGGQSRVR